MLDLQLNFIGVNAADFQREYAFYTEGLGMRPPQSPPAETPASWAMLVAGWDATPVPGSRGLRCELFERDVAPPAERHWGQNQNVRPSIQVADLQATVAEFEARDVSFTDDRIDPDWGQSIELATPEGVRWSIAQPEKHPTGPGIRTPHIGWVELKVADLSGQREFYTETMGLSDGGRTAAGVRLEQGEGEPFLFLAPGGEPVSKGRDRSPFDVQPVWLSFETTDITRARAWVSADDRPIVRDVTTHDWGGTDLVTRDPDGNPLQVVAYEP